MTDNLIAGNTPPENRAAAPPPLGAGTVFVVDDDPAALDSVAALVESMGRDVATFPSAEAFLESYDPNRAGCLVTDLRMRGMTGLELLERLTQGETALPVIVVTAFADVPVAVRAMKHGAVTLLQKPCRENELWEAIRNALAVDARWREERARLRTIRERLATLSPDEQRVLDQVMAGKANKQIALKLDLGLRTVEAKRHSIMAKMHADSLPQLVQMISQVRPIEDGH